MLNEKRKGDFYLTNFKESFRNAIRQCNGLIASVLVDDDDDWKAFSIPVHWKDTSKFKNKRIRINEVQI
uniref:Uncharacterized protein n=1 Tax=Romanomermis culicivorax TaxID=13658 RepID=A0A915L2A2_ROMCU